jgi:hypothetical protein
MARQLTLLRPQSTPQRPGGQWQKPRMHSPTPEQPLMHTSWWKSRVTTLEQLKSCERRTSHHSTARHYHAAAHTVDRTRVLRALRQLRSSKRSAARQKQWAKKQALVLLQGLARFKSTGSSGCCWTALVCKGRGNPKAYPQSIVPYFTVAHVVNARKSAGGWKPYCMAQHNPKQLPPPIPKTLCRRDWV